MAICLRRLLSIIRFLPAHVEKFFSWEHICFFDTMCYCKLQGFSRYLEDFLTNYTCIMCRMLWICIGILCWIQACWCTAIAGIAHGPDLPFRSPKLRCHNRGQRVLQLLLLLLPLFLSRVYQKILLPMTRSFISPTCTSTCIYTS